GGGGDVAGLDRQGTGPDGLRLRGGPIRSVPPRGGGRPPGGSASLLRLVAVDRHGPGNPRCRRHALGRCPTLADSPTARPGGGLRCPAVVARDNRRHSARDPGGSDGHLLAGRRVLKVQPTTCSATRRPADTEALRRGQAPGLAGGGRLRRRHGCLLVLAAEWAAAMADASTGAALPQSERPARFALRLRPFSTGC